MTDNQRQILRSAMPEWKDEDYEMANAVEAMMETPGWKYLQNIWKDQREVIFKLMQKARKDDCVWRLIGIMEGHDITTGIAEKILNEKTSRRSASQADLSEVLDGLEEMKNGALA